MSANSTDGDLLPVQIEKFEPTSPISPSSLQDGGGGARKRLHVATEHFPVGTTANTVCEHAMTKYGTTNAMGLWLLQTKEQDGAENSEEGGYVTVKDSKYQLQKGVDYHVIHFTGSGMFLYS